MKLIKYLEKIALASLIESLGGKWGFQKGFKKSIDDEFSEKKTDLIAFINNKIKLNIEEKDLNSYTFILKIIKQLNENKKEEIFNIMSEKLKHSLVPKGVYIPTRKDFD